MMYYVFIVICAVLVVLITFGVELDKSTPSILRDIKQYVLYAVKQNGYALKYASASLRADRETVMCAVKQNGRALKFASDALRADRETVMCAVKQNGRALKYASASLRAELSITS